jgi:hypothetical protein
MKAIVAYFRSSGGAPIMRGILFGAIGVAVGVAATLFVGHLNGRPAVQTGLSKLVTHPNQFGVTYATEAIFSDIPPPDITALTGTYKFLDPIASENETTKFGYLIDLKMDQIELSKVPQKYLETKALVVDGHPITSPPITSASYGIIFSFQLKDIDGFVLTNLSSKQEDVVSGKSNHLQNIIETPVSFQIAIRTRQVDVIPSIEKCFTCGREYAYDDLV